MSLKISRKWDQNGVPFGAQNEIASLRHFLPRRHLLVFFGIFLYGVLEVLGCLLGVSWVSCVSLVGSLVPKTCKNSMYFKGFEKTILCLWWLFWARLGLSCKLFLNFVQKCWSKLCFKTALLSFLCWVKSHLKKINKKKWIIYASFFEQIWVFFWVSFWDQIGQRGARWAHGSHLEIKEPKCCILKILKNPSCF